MINEYRQAKKTLKEGKKKNTPLQELIAAAQVMNRVWKTLPLRLKVYGYTSEEISSIRAAL